MESFHIYDKPSGLERTEKNGRRGAGRDARPGCATGTDKETAGAGVSRSRSGMPAEAGQACPARTGQA